jgi:hypothetical protein
MRRKQTAQQANVGLKHRHIDVTIKRNLLLKKKNNNNNNNNIRNSNSKSKVFVAKFFHTFATRRTARSNSERRLSTASVSSASISVSAAPTHV